MCCPRSGSLIINRRHNTDPAAASVLSEGKGGGGGGVGQNTGSILQLPPPQTLLMCGEANRQVPRVGVCCDGRAVFPTINSLSLHTGLKSMPRILTSSNHFSNSLTVAKSISSYPDVRVII